MKVSGINQEEGGWLAIEAAGWWIGGAAPLLSPPLYCLLLHLLTIVLPRVVFVAKASAGSLLITLVPALTRRTASPPHLQSTLLRAFFHLRQKPTPTQEPFTPGLLRPTFNISTGKIAAIVFAENIFSSVLSSCGAWPNRQVKFSLGKPKSSDSCKETFGWNEIGKGKF